jgi:general stress protein YciG
MATAKKQPQGEMTVREAGRKGGETTAERHGHEFYEEIGRKGGTKVRDEYGVQFYEEIGHKGGQKVKDLIEEGKRAMERKR